MQTARIYIFGDSIVYGAWDSQGGWCDRLKQKLHQHTLNSTTGEKYQVYNLGIGGDTSTALLKRFTAEMTARHRPDWPTVLIIAIGANDSRRTATSTTPLTDLNTYRHNLEQLIALGREYTDKIMLVGIAPVKTGTQELKGNFFSNDTLADYDLVMTQVAQAHTIPKVNVLTALGKNSDALHVNDGVHLNDTGHQRLAALVWPTLAKLLQPS